MRKNKIDLLTAANLADKLMQDSGFTYPNPPRHGFMVGGAGRLLKVPYNEAQFTADADIVKLRLTDLIHSFDEPDGGYLGGWINRENGDAWLYIEESEHYVTRTRALQVATKRGELGIYALADKKTIKLEDMR